jgi:predicted component of type VI protein secretion system
MALGRDPQCDLKVDDAAVSRQHCTIARKGAAFILRDHSSNGTFVTIAGQGEARIHDQELALGRSGGLISLGQSAAATEHVISYVCEGG